MVAGLGWGIDLMGVEGQVQRLGKMGAEFAVAVGLLAAQAVVEVSQVQDQAFLFRQRGQQARQGDRVRASGDADGETKAGREKCGVDR